jgi:drug/metabolite transporter (DMT)-like permease
MDWRILAIITAVSWGAYSIVLKAVSGRLAWQWSMLWFVIGYVAVVAAFCLVQAQSVKDRFWQAPSFWALAAGLLCGVGAITFFKGLPSAPGSVFLPLIGLYVLVSAVGCLIFLHEPFSWRLGLGIICATAAVMLLGK